MSSENFVATAGKLGYYEASFQRVFWGEQPPFTPLGRGGRYFFNDEIRIPNVEKIRASLLIRHSSFVLCHSERARVSWPMASALVALITALLIGFIFYRTETWPMRTTHQGVDETERVARAVKNAFVSIAHLQPRITINNRVYVEQTTPTSELALVSRQIEVEHEFVHTWIGSSKRVKLHGTFNVKAGFDLRQNLSVDVRPTDIIIQLPHAQILDVAQQRVDVLVFENGFWNRISAADVQNELSMLPELARQKAADGQLPAIAERSLQQQLEQRVHTAQPLKLVFSEPKPID
jgi:hypothetical protein